MLWKLFAVIGVSMLISANSMAAEIKSRIVTYKSSDGTIMHGFVAYEDKPGKRPGILIVHDWMGITEFNKNKALQLAKEGYVAFAVDVYGKSAASPEEAKDLSSQYKNDRPKLREHMNAAYKQLVDMQETDPLKIVVMGYCFGGTAALELARSGAKLAGTVTFHGGLSNPVPDSAKNINGKVLVLHGADDPLVPPSEVEAFKKEMKEAKVDMKFIAYPGAVHAFTNPNAGKVKGTAYNEVADKASWKEFEKFMKEVF